MDVVAAHETKQSGRLRSLDVLRGLAASLVALRHAFEGPFLVGAIGVDIFFIISGFVMTKVSAGRSAPDFLTDRAWRIFPTYWIALALFMLFAVGSGQSLSIRDSLGSALLMPNWFGLGILYLGVAWTLLFELFFYLAVALGIWLGSWRLPLLMFVLALVARPFVASPLIEFAGSPIMIEFIFGIVIATLPLNRRIGAGLVIAAILFLAFFPNPWLEDYRLAMSYGDAFVRVALWGIPAAMIVYGALAFEQGFKGPLVKCLLVAGAASYSIYLIHMIIIKMVMPGRPMLGFISSLVVGIAMWWFVERRLMAIRPRSLISTLGQRLLGGSARSQPERA